MRKITELKNDRKGNANMLYEMLIIFAVVVIIGILVFTLNEDARADLTDGSYGENATIEADKGAKKIFDNLDLIGLTVAFGVVLYVIFRVLPGRGGGF